MREATSASVAILLRKSSEMHEFMVRNVGGNYLRNVVR